MLWMSSMLRDLCKGKSGLMDPFRWIIDISAWTMSQGIHVFSKLWYMFSFPVDLRQHCLKVKIHRLGGTTFKLEPSVSLHSLSHSMDKKWKQLIFPKNYIISSVEYQQGIWYWHEIYIYIYIQIYTDKNDWLILHFCIKHDINTTSCVFFLGQFMT